MTSEELQELNFLRGYLAYLRVESPLFKCSTRNIRIIRFLG
jgi:hypothetical protein